MITKVYHVYIVLKSCLEAPYFLFCGSHAYVTVIALNCPYVKQKKYFRDDLRWVLLWLDMIWTMTLHTITTGILLKRLIFALNVP